MARQKEKARFGDLPPHYHFSLNPYPDMRFSSCPRCQAKTGQRKLPLLIHIDPHVLMALNYTNRYCKRCDLLIAHKAEIEHYLTEMFRETGHTGFFQNRRNLANLRGANFLPPVILGKKRHFSKKPVCPDGLLLKKT